MAREKVIYKMTENLTTAQCYAVVGNAEKFEKHKHAWKVWKALKQFGCVVYPVAQGLPRIEGAKVYPELRSLKDKVDVVVPCLLPDLVPQLVEETLEAGAKFIWFQEQTWTPDFEEKCQQYEIDAVRGCVLKHKLYKKPLGYFNPCYWHGLHDSKVKDKRWV